MIVKAYTRYGSAREQLERKVHRQSKTCAGGADDRIAPGGAAPARISPRPARDERAQAPVDLLSSISPPFIQRHFNLPSPSTLTPLCFLFSLSHFLSLFPPLTVQFSSFFFFHLSRSIRRKDWNGVSNNRDLYPIDLQ